LELAENLNLNPVQQNTVSNLVVSVLPDGSDTQTAFGAMVRNKERLIPQIRGLLNDEQKQRFSAIYRADGVGLFTVATLSVEAQKQK